jgi:hypothetical protein
MATAMLGALMQKMGGDMGKMQDDRKKATQKPRIPSTPPPTNKATGK